MPCSRRFRRALTKCALKMGAGIGTLDDGTRVRTPGAFADWPPNDVQPPWSDVTYLRLYDHPSFNHMAYNTLRMYDAFLAQPEHRNAPLVERLIGIIPHYQQHFGIDGVLIDMGHALPMPLKQRIIATARAADPDFAFGTRISPIDGQTRERGYNAVVGYWLLSVHEAHSVRNLIHQMAHHAFPIAFFGAMENHNTPRAFARYGGVATPITPWRSRLAFQPFLSSKAASSWRDSAAEHWAWLQQRGNTALHSRRPALIQPLGI